MLTNNEPKVRSFIKFLNNKRLTRKLCKVVILHEYDSVSYDGAIAFALYAPHENTMYVAGDLDYLIAEEDFTEEDVQNMLMENIAHEYVHHLQWSEDKEICEDEATKRAGEFVEEYLEEKKKTKKKKEC